MEELKLKEILQSHKKAIDLAYEATANKHSQEQASFALYNYLTSDNSQEYIKYFTRDNKARNIISKLDNTVIYEYFQIISDYVIGTFINNNMNFDNISKEELKAYETDFNGELDYTNEEKILKLFAASLSINTFFALNTYALNKKMKAVIVKKFIEERYINKGKNVLDNSKPAVIKKLFGKSVQLSKNKLNRDVAIMKKDEELQNIPFSFEDLEEYEYKPKKHL